RQTKNLSDLRTYLGGRTLLARDRALWGEGRIHLEFACYLTDLPPPIEYVTSVRCLLFKGDAVLVERDLDGMHILPGGRREPGETLDQTLRREVLEECGWTIDTPRLLGCLHFHHLTPKPPEYAYIYPDFVQTIFTANAVSHFPDHRVQDDYVVESTFRTLSEIADLDLPAGQRLLLAAAIRAFSRPGLNAESPPSDLPSRARSN